MKSVTELWVYRVFFGTWLGCVAFPFAWIAFRTGKLPEIPSSVVLLTLGLMGGDALRTFLSSAPAAALTPGSKV
jgi:hypothetical protein